MNIDKPCSVFNAFNFKRDVQERIGHLTTLKIGDTTLTADITLKQPTDEADTKVVGVISNLSWAGGYAEPIQISFNVSVTNKNAITTLVHNTMKSIVIEWTYNIFEYDKEAKTYYLAFHTNSAAVKGVIQTVGQDRVFYISDIESSEVQKPENYSATIGTVPEDTQQDIHMATSNTQKFVLPWGVTRG